MAEVARHFVLLRITNMRGVDLGVFDFDFDLTWAAIFLQSDGTTLGRYGSRVAESHGKQLSIDGLRYAMTQALAFSRLPKGGEGAALPFGKRLNKQTFKHVEDYPAAQRLTAKSCIHCHNVYDFRRELKQAQGKWKKDDVWVHPEPENIGLSLDIHQGNRIIAINVPSPTHTAGLRRGDVLKTVHLQPIASIADVRYALQYAPAQGQIPITWTRDGKDYAGELDLPAGWRVTDISWRWSLKGIHPAPGLHGEDLSAAQKTQLGLDPKRLAFRQGNFLTQQARQAGIQINDIILGFDGRRLEMNARQFDVFVRLNYKVGDTVTVHFIRDGRRMEVGMKLF